MRRIDAVAVLVFLIFITTPVSAAYDANGVALGASEMELKKAFPSAFCKPLEWASRAADRRCDDAKGMFAGVEVRITFYLKKGALEAFDVRFDARDTDRIAGFLKSRYGAPASEDREKLVYKLQWEAKGERAVMTAVTDKRRVSLLVWRGDFEEEIYRVR